MESEVDNYNSRDNLFDAVEDRESVEDSCYDIVLLYWIDCSYLVLLLKAIR